jgi:hypothetical protein
MRIYIKEGTGRRFCIPVPLALFRVFINIAAIWIRKSKNHKYMGKINQLENINLENINFVQLSQSLQYLKGYRGMKIVEVKSKDGDEVTIIL